jgi:hypothetical protein
MDRGAQVEVAARAPGARIEWCSSMKLGESRDPYCAGRAANTRRAACPSVRLRPPRKVPESPTASSSADVLDTFVWDGVAEVATAAHRRDAPRCLKAFSRLGEGRSLASHRLAGLYATYLLKYRTAAVLGHPPGIDDVSALAARLQADFDQMLPRSPAGCLVETLLVSFELNSARPSGTYATFALRSLVALGLHLDTPANDLALMKPHLANWCLRRADSIRQVTEAPPSQ